MPENRAGLVIPPENQVMQQRMMGMEAARQAALSNSRNADTVQASQYAQLQDQTANVGGDVRETREANAAQARNATQTYFPPNRDNSEDNLVPYNYTPLEAYTNVPIQEPKLDISTKLLEEYGNNYFELITYDQGIPGGDYNGGPIRLAGVLKDLPSFNMNSTWESGPAQTISDTVKGFMCSPTMEMVTTLGGRDRAWMSLDEGTDRTYKTTSKPSFDLSFKLYTNENIGSEPLTNYKTWIKALSLYTMPSIDAKVSINAMANNAFNGLYGSIDLISDIANAVKEGFNGRRTTDENGREIMEIPKDADVLNKLGNAVTSAVNTGSQHITNRYDENRVNGSNNAKNFFGAKLWYLRILPGIFRNPLIVYVNNWGVTYSKEINPDTHEPIWVEFKINCEMDQIASAPIWMKYLTGSTDVKTPYMKQYYKDNKQS